MCTFKLSPKSVILCNTVYTLGKLQVKIRSIRRPQVKVQVKFAYLGHGARLLPSYSFRYIYGLGSLKAPQGKSRLMRKTPDRERDPIAR